jgi:16S rRNA (guanine966-N2)-methyltransferase
MRIIAGKWRGRPIAAPAGTGTRPTSDRVREALFSMLASRLGDFEGLTVVDLFAGSGALGLEALSRGAARCVFVEQDRAALAALSANIARLGAGGETQVRAQSALSAGSGPVHLMLVDPPYESGWGHDAIARWLAAGALAPGCIVSLETAAREPVEIEGLSIIGERRYGKTKLSLLRRDIVTPDI